MSELTDTKRDNLDDDQFAYIDPSGDRKLPINDESHVRNALARFSQTEFDDSDARQSAAKKILSAARKHDIEVSDDDAVMRAAH